MPGQQCNLVQHQLFLPGSPNRALTNFPYHLNYTLGPVPGSVCDSLTGYHEQQRAAARISISSNPGDGLFKLTVDGYLLNKGPGQCTVVDITGRVVLRQKVNAPINYLNMTACPDGIYLLKVATTEKTLSVKLIKQRE
jgi:hypothetical protein